MIFLLTAWHLCIRSSLALSLQVYLALIAVSKSYRLYLYSINNTFELLWSRPVIRSMFYICYT
jgi:hypothetical protein